MRPPHVRLTDGKWRRERDSNPRAVRPLVFKTSAIDHSAISPRWCVYVAGDNTDHVIWQAGQESNLQPADLEAAALPN